MARRISWIKAAQKAFLGFPLDAQDQILTALRLAATGRKADIAKPLKGFGSGILEVALAHRGDAYRTVYAVQFGDDLWVIHAFKKKSSQGIKTPKKDLDVIEERIKHLKRELRS
ncbi:type II toxin-antitoxin system RelE/ParE family toxin [Candidatus Nitronereus thalassa]|uniref:Type II toxin-antitoxin system RelE/ParE family toxin n=1 Tax=Candidatus Nitronereus thalassa TaxID=3020898 RepID=A0ABU3KBB5_9BACT|nr:type II toxin-antitoxin system RelE/ParE family toxin [Candidatus Nitronereus thalassa]MDT7043598.1 type II toxin-antitoxin system RelE/ParE family toxin [Candidatus Nitronereus thalassa]